jgi:hypothetical protein
MRENRQYGSEGGVGASRSRPLSGKNDVALLVAMRRLDVPHWVPGLPRIKSGVARDTRGATRCFVTPWPSTSR